MDGRHKRIKKFAFTSVCVYNRLRVDGAKVPLISMDLRKEYARRLIPKMREIFTNRLRNVSASIIARSSKPLFN